MELNKLVAHHQKCMDVLEMIERCRRRKMSYHVDQNHPMLGSWYRKQLSIMDAVEERLTTYYLNLITNHK